MAYIYFISCDAANAVKIGYTDGDPTSRLRQLDSTGTPGELSLMHAAIGTRDDEQRLHDKFSAARIRSNREWFHLSDEIRTFIAHRRWERDGREGPFLSAFADYCGRLSYNIGSVAAAQECLRDLKRVAESDPVLAALLASWRAYANAFSRAVICADHAEALALEAYRPHARADVAAQSFRMAFAKVDVARWVEPTRTWPRPSLHLADELTTTGAAA